MATIYGLSPEGDNGIWRIIRRNTSINIKMYDELRIYFENECIFSFKNISNSKWECIYPAIKNVDEVEVLNTINTTLQQFEM